MKAALVLIQMISGGLIVALVMLQSKGTGLGRSLGGQMYHSRRGLESLLFKVTIAMVIIFVVTAIVTQLFVK